MKNHKLRRILLLVVCAAAIAAVSVSATMAYLTSTASVKNTFTIGQVAITLDETKTDADGVAVTPATRISGIRSAGEQYTNTYHLVPGRTYTKDPVVHVTAGSEDSWIFVKVENGIAAYETEDEDAMLIAEQIEANGWIALTGVENVYCKPYVSSTTTVDLPVFEDFTIDDDANEIAGWDDISAANTTVTVTAYAIQKDGFSTVLEAWMAGGWN